MRLLVDAEPVDQADPDFALARSLLNRAVYRTPKYLRCLGLRLKHPPLRRPWYLVRCIGRQLRVFFRAISNASRLANRVTLKSALPFIVLGCLAAGSYWLGKWMESNSADNDSYTIDLVAWVTTASITALLAKWIGPRLLHRYQRRAKRQALAQQHELLARLARRIANELDDLYKLDEQVRYEIAPKRVAFQSDLGSLPSDLDRSPFPEDLADRVAPNVVDRLWVQASHALGRAERIELLSEYGIWHDTYWAVEAVAHASKCRPWSHFPALAGATVARFDRLQELAANASIARTVEALAVARDEVLAHDSSTLEWMRDSGQKWLSECNGGPPTPELRRWASELRSIGTLAFHLARFVHVTGHFAAVHPYSRKSGPLWPPDVRGEVVVPTSGELSDTGWYRLPEATYLPTGEERREGLNVRFDVTIDRILKGTRRSAFPHPCKQPSPVADLIPSIIRHCGRTAARAVISEIWDPEERVRAMMALANAEPDAWHEALSLAEEIEEPWPKVRAFVFLSSRDPFLLSRARIAARLIHDPIGRSWCQAALVPQIAAHDSLASGRDAAEELPPLFKAWALAAMVPQVADHAGLRVARAIATTIQDAWARSRALVSLIDFDESLVRAARASAESIPDPWARLRSLTPLVAHDAAALAPARDAVEALERPYRAWGTVSLVPSIATVEGSRVARSMIEDLDDTRSRSWGLAALIMHLARSGMPVHRATWEKISDFGAKARALTCLAEVSSDLSLRNEALWAGLHVEYGIRSWDSRVVGKMVFGPKRLDMVKFDHHPEIDLLW